MDMSITLSLIIISITNKDTPNRGEQEFPFPSIPGNKSL